MDSLIDIQKLSGGFKLGYRAISGKQLHIKNKVFKRTFDIYKFLTLHTCKDILCTLIPLSDKCLNYAKYVDTRELFSAKRALLDDVPELPNNNLLLLLQKAYPLTQHMAVLASGNCDLMFAIAHLEQFILSLSTTKNIAVCK